MKYIKKKESILETAPGLIIDNTEMDDKIINTYSANIIDNITTNPSLSVNDVPAGIGLRYYGDALPKDFLYCNESGVSANVYPELYTALGNTYGSATIPASSAVDGVAFTVFKLPNEEYWVIKSEPNIDKLDDILTFKIGNNSYSVVRGMTWTDWVNSSFNTGGWDLNPGSSIGDIYNGNSTYVTYPKVLSDIGCSVTNVDSYIIPNMIYSTYTER